MAKYTYSRSLMSVEGNEVFTAEEFSSFDEAKKAVDRGIYDRKLELDQKYPGVGIGLGAGFPIGGSTLVPPAQKLPTTGSSGSQAVGHTVENGNVPTEVLPKE